MDGAQYARACLHYNLYFDALCARCPQVSSRSQLSATDLIADKPPHKSKTAIGSTVAPRSQHDIDSGSLTSLRALVEALYEI